jgi:branched-chain amino acid transport system ATP-binding protein
MMSVVNHERFTPLVVGPIVGGAPISRAGTTSSVVLHASELTVRFGGLSAVSNLNLEVRSHSVHALIGPNGAGKSTAVNALSGFAVLNTGSVSIGGKTSGHWTAHAIAKAGLARTFQNIRLFGEMTVLETILVGRHAGFQGGLFAALFRTKSAVEFERNTVEEARALIKFVGLPPNVEDVPANSLPYGHQRRVEIARALISKPKVLLLDEPLAGMNVSEKAALSELIHQVRESGVAILLIEHDMDVIRSLANFTTVLYQGKKLISGTTNDVLSHAEVQAAYLGRAKT